MSYTINDNFPSFSLSGKSIDYQCDLLQPRPQPLVIREPEAGPIYWVREGEPWGSDAKVSDQKNYSTQCMNCLCIALMPFVYPGCWSLNRLKCDLVVQQMCARSGAKLHSEVSSLHEEGRHYRVPVLGCWHSIILQLCSTRLSTNKYVHRNVWASAARIHVCSHSWKWEQTEQGLCFRAWTLGKR